MTSSRPPNTIALGVRASTYGFEGGGSGGTHIQSIIPCVWLSDRFKLESTWDECLMSLVQGQWVTVSEICFSGNILECIV